LTIRYVETEDFDYGIRIQGAGLDASPSTFFRRAGEELNESVNKIGMHSASHKLGVRDADVEVYVPVSKQTRGEPPTPTRVEKFTVASTSPSQVIKVLEGRGGPEAPWANGDKRLTDYDRLKEDVKRLEPPKGGGIALKAASELPLNPDNVAGVKWDEGAGRLVVIGKKENQFWRLPMMDPEILKVAYRCVFTQQAADPEISIGAPFGKGREIAAVGKRPVYYSGPIEDTLFGLILLRADQALGDIAYGGHKELTKYHLDKMPGYHALPELYPAKYAQQPQAKVLIGSDERIVIQSLSSRLTIKDGHDLEYVHEPELGVRFGRTTPAERAYADVFGTYYDAILREVPELRDLIECARAIGIFKWFSLNKVSFLPEHRLALTAQRSVFTPHEVNIREMPRLEEISLTRPLVQYSDDGPADVFRDSGEHIRLDYEQGRIKRVVRGDGRKLEVYTDDQGTPIGVEVEGRGAAAFSCDSEGPCWFLTNVLLLRDEGKVKRYSRLASCSSAPETDAWGLIETMALGFMR